MSESKKVDHWAFLATELGAALPEPEISLETSPFAEEIPAEKQPVKADSSPTPPESQIEDIASAEQVAEEPLAAEPPPTRRQRPRSSWDLLANELGIEVPPEPEPEPTPEPTATVPSPVVERAVAERMFESLFNPPDTKAEAEETIPAWGTPAKERPATSSREESQPVARRDKKHEPNKRDEPRRGGRQEDSRRSDKAEQPRHDPKSDLIELFLDEAMEPEEFEPAFNQAEEAVEMEEKKKRSRRRRGRKDREREPEQRKPEKPALPTAKMRPEEDEEENDEFSFFDEPEEKMPRSLKDKPKAEVEEEEEERPGKRRRSRRGARKSKTPAAETVEERKPPAKGSNKFAEEVKDDLWDEEDEEIESHPVGYSRRSGSSRESGGRPSREVRPAFLSIPTWNDAIGSLVAKNMESRGKRPGGGQSRGGRRDNRR